MANVATLVIQGFSTLGMTGYGFAKVRLHVKDNHVHATVRLANIWLRIFVSRLHLPMNHIHEKFQVISSNRLVLGDQAYVHNVESGQRPAVSAAVLLVALGTVCVALSRTGSSTRGQKVSTRVKAGTEGR